MDGWKITLPFGRVTVQGQTIKLLWFFHFTKKKQLNVPKVALPQKKMAHIYFSPGRWDVPNGEKTAVQQVTVADVFTDDCDEGLDLRQLRATAERAATCLGEIRKSRYTGA